MPTVILLDMSLSMFRPIPSSDANEIHTRFSLACVAINTFIDYLNIHAKLEYVALVTYSSTHDVSVPFTRDLDLIRTKLLHLEVGDKTCLDDALTAVNQLVLNEWGSQTAVQIILVTDGCIGVGPIGRAKLVEGLPLPPPYPCRIHIVPIAGPQEHSLQQAMLLYQRVVELASNSSNPTVSVSKGIVYCPDTLTVPGVIQAITKLSEQQYAELWCTLRCGQLEARVQLFPPPSPPPTVPPLSNVINIIGFISTQDLGTPITISKHLLLPQATVGPNSARDNFEPKTPTKDAPSTDVTMEEDASDPSKVPNFCVLLHGALKVENMSAIVSLAPNWRGCLSLWCEAARARRSCLILAALEPGVRAAPWLGSLGELGPADGAVTESFPIRATRSYSASNPTAAWSRPHALLADLHKLCRHARKLPDKTQHLYKELNRLRRAAISLGFSELLTCVSNALERERAALPSNAPPECALQLTHAANALRDPRTAFDIKHTLTPLAPGFTQH